MLSKTVAPKTKAELIRALQGASFRSVDIFECDRLKDISLDLLKRNGGTIIVLR